VGEDVLVSLGVAPDRIFWERESRNTAENARLTRALVRASPGEDWVLVTSAFHMGRALSSFEAAGWPPLIPYPVDHRSGRFMAGIGWDLPGKLAPLNIALKEWTGRLAYRAFAR
ncbi:MAG: YdcF family protein, partial [Pseudomonadota bacterium]